MTAADEAVEFCRDLIRMDTTNTGDTQTSAGERVAAEYVAAENVILDYLKSGAKDVKHFTAARVECMRQLAELGKRVCAKGASA